MPLRMAFVLAGACLVLGQEKRLETPIFGDDFELGNTDAWDEVVPNIEAPNCDCYFSGDCLGGNFCNWGPGGPSTEDICNWREPKPNGNPGTGCTADVVAWGPICDGLCSPPERGSFFGLEDPVLVIDGIRLWAAAMMEPALQGGGPLDAQLAAEARAVPFFAPGAPDILGRHVADLLAFGVDAIFQEHFCHFEHHPLEPGPVVDLSSNYCGQVVAQCVVDALVAEITEPGTGAALMNDITDACADGQALFTSRCRPDIEVLACAHRRISALARMLTTVPIARSSR